MVLLELKDISYRVKEKEIFSGLSLSVETREVHAILGKNGTGKSTLAYLVMGYEGYIPATGEILFDRKDINHLLLHERAKLGITMAWQEPVRFEGISVRDYLTLKNKEIDPSKYLEMAGLHPGLYLNRMMDSTLSGGERKRIELASVVALYPRLVILDEPDSSIDMLSIQDILNVITGFKENGASVILITHREEIAIIADKASEICNGKIICTGTPEKVTQYYKTRKCEVCAGRNVPLPELDELLKSFGEAGGDKSILANTEHLVASVHKILSRRAVKGIKLEAVESEKGISASVRLLKGTRLLNPVHLCFGVLHRSGIQEINMRVNFEKDSEASFIAHCIFLKAEKVKHIMDVVIDIGENATMRYSEIHYHGIYGGIEVYPKARVTIGKNGRYFTDFLLINGRGGKLVIDYGVEVGVTELIARVFGHAIDDISIKEIVALNGVNSKGLIKTRVAIENNARAQVIGITEGNARGARGHVDCMEIVKDNAIEKAIPFVKK